jgi:hypothetical protein
MQDELAIVLSTVKQSKQQEAEQRLRVEHSRGASKHKKQRRVEQSKQRSRTEQRCRRVEGTSKEEEDGEARIRAFRGGQGGVA